MLFQKIENALNIQRHEWPRVSLSWSLGLLIRTSYVILWTLIMALFISRRGVESLAVLFILNAIGIIIGTILYSEFLRRFDERKVTIFTSLMAAATFLTAFYLSGGPFEKTFLALLLTGLSVFLTQLFILINLFIEELFSPLESQRTFPVIESYETIGGILGGLIISSFAGINSTSVFIVIAALASILIAILIHAVSKKIRKIPLLEFHHQKNHKFEGLKFRKNWQKIKSIPFLKSLALIIFFQFILFTLVEFQFATAIVSELKPNPIEYSQAAQNHKISFIPEHLTTSILSTQETRSEEIKAEHQLEDDIVHKLGLIVMLASIAALSVQLLISSRLLNRLGIIKSMIFHPIVICINSFLLIWKFGMMAGSSLKIGFEVTNGIFNNSYHSSYYCLKEKDRSQMKEFMDGFMKPMGIIIGTSILFLAHEFAYLLATTQIINLSLIGVALLMLVPLMRARRQYTDLSLENLEKNEVDSVTKENAVEILTQKGHRDISDELLKKLSKEGVENQLKVKIIDALSQIGHSSSIPTIIQHLNHEERQIKLAAIKALRNYGRQCNLFLDKAFTKYQIINHLKELFQNENSNEIKTEIIRTLVELHEKEIIEFIINILNKEDNKEILSNTIEICQAFDDECLAKYLEKYLNDADLKVKASTMIALWKFHKYRQEIQIELNNMFNSENKDKLMTAFHISGEIGDRDKIFFLKSWLSSNDLEIRSGAAIALVKMECHDAISQITKLILHENKVIAFKAKSLTEKLKPHLQKLIQIQVNNSIVEKINNLLKGHSHKNIQNLPHHILHKLKHYYEIVGQSQEVLHLEQMIKYHRQAMV